MTASSFEPTSERRKRMIYLRERADTRGVLVSTEPGEDDAPRTITIRWRAGDDLNDAAKRIFELVGVHINDFAHGPERVGSSPPAEA